MSEGPTELQPVPPPPSTRSLEVVLREALEAGEEVRLLIGKGLPDTGLANPAAYANVDLGDGTAVPVPKLAGAPIGGAGTNYPVYVLATKDFLLALGTVGGAQSGSVVPVGAILPYAGSSAPAGYLLCDGSSFSGATYPRLQTVLGGTVLPDLRKRVPVGSGSGLGLGATDGLAEGSRHPLHHHRVTSGVPVSVTINGVGDHDHPAVGDHYHGHPQGDFATTFYNTGQRGTSGTTFTLVSGGGPTTNPAGGHSHGNAGAHSHSASASASIDADTSGGGPSNGPSYYVLNYIIRAA